MLHSSSSASASVWVTTTSTGGGFGDHAPQPVRQPGRVSVILNPAFQIACFADIEPRPPCRRACDKHQDCAGMVLSASRITAVPEAIPPSEVGLPEQDRQRGRNVGSFDRLRRAGGVLECGGFIGSALLRRAPRRAEDAPTPASVIISSTDPRHWIVNRLGRHSYSIYPRKSVDNFVEKLERANRDAGAVKLLTFCLNFRQ